MPQLLKVRLCEESDLPSLRAREALPEARLADQHFAQQNQGEYFFAVAFRDDLPMGSVVLDCRTGPLQPEMKNLWVNPDARRQGVGSALVTFIEDLGEAQKFEEIFFGIDPENPSAIPMYLELGYAPTGQHRDVAYVSVEPDGTTVERPQTESIYRKSLRYR